jgi:hypothetical protein
MDTVFLSYAKEDSESVKSSTQSCFGIDFSHGSTRTIYSQLKTGIM